MGAPRRRHLTIKDVAAAAGVALSTASCALRNHPSLPKHTCERVQQVAARLGYRPNPQVAMLMAHIGRGRPISKVNGVALVWVHGSRRITQEAPLLQQVRAGAMQRAEVRGYRLDEFWVQADGISGARLTTILLSRGIRSVVFAPAFFGVEVDFALDWSKFSVVALGHARWPVELHRVAHDHYHATSFCLGRVTAAGCKNPGLLATWPINLRTDRAIEAAFVTHHPHPTQAERMIHFADPAAPKATALWLRKAKPDGLIVLEKELWPRPPMPRAERLRRNGRAWTLKWEPGEAGRLPGVEHRYDNAAAAAVDLAIASEQQNMIGLPEAPQSIHMRGEWKEGTGD